MEINKLNDLYIKLSEKYSYQLIDTDNDGNITETEVLSLAYQDTDLRAELDDSDLELIKDFISVEETSAIDTTAETKNVSDTNQTTSTQKTSKTEVKTTQEYLDIINNKFEELYEKYGGDSEKVNQYVKDNFSEFADIDGDGRLTILDKYIWEQHYNSKPHPSSDEYKEKGRDYWTARNSFSSILHKGFVNQQLTGNELLNLDDLENFYKLTNSALDYTANGNTYATFIMQNIDVAKIATQDNWEERWKNVCEKLGLSDWSRHSRMDDINEKLSQVKEFMKNNPDKKGYAGLAAYFTNYAEARDKTFEGDKEIYNDFGVESLHNQYMNSFIKGCLNYTDINGDGTIDIEDLNALSMDIDLDGDGKVSNDERNFLKQVKLWMKDKVYKDATRKSYHNSMTIDEVINYTEKFDTEKYINDLSGEYKSYFTTHIFRGVLSGCFNLGLAYASALLASGSPQILRTGYMDGTGSVIGVQDVKGFVSGKSEDEIISIMKQNAEASKPINSYIHYIKSADLSKEQLTEILNKINSSSASVQSQLTEIKKAVEEKLEGMN